MTIEALRQRGLKPVAQLARDKPHGTRLRYMAGCKCKDCRKANSAYENERQRARRRGDWNGIVDAAPARAHMLELSKQGVGRRSIQAATDIADSVLFQIRNGTRPRIRARTARKILAVTRAQAGDHTNVPAKRTWRVIAWILEEGYTKGWIAKQLGRKGYGIQLGKKRVHVRNAAKIEALWRRIST